ncbi:MAG: sigma-70 family RNA polymerase sigma factor [Akkermansiaceae bacterium]|nr:sigma-70 family RNA polymerase sigma factor [Akkermansiaceae bacterium]
MEAEELAAVLDRIAAGHVEDFQFVVRAYGLPLRSYLAGQVYHIDDADDLAQETFITAYRKLATFQRDSDFGAWLRGIARNLARMHFRSAGRRSRALDRFRAEVAEIAGEELDAASSSRRSEDIGALLRCVARLPERMRRAVRAGLDGEQPSKIAAEFKTSVNAVYQIHWRAHQLLRECVSKELAR